ncbi:MAG: hypothetical protein WBP46_09775 [Thiolinea sp.]
MRLSLITLCLGLSLSLPSIAVAESSKVQQIRQNYEHLQLKMCNFDPQELKLNTSGLESVAFKDKQGQVQMLKVTAVSETGQNVKEFFYEDNALIFVKEKSQRFNSSFYGSAVEAKAQGVEAYDPLKTISTENHYFFADNQLIEWQDQNKQAVASQAVLFKQQEAALLNQSSQMLVQVALK